MCNLISLVFCPRPRHGSPSVLPGWLASTLTSQPRSPGLCDTIVETHGSTGNNFHIGLISEVEWLWWAVSDLTTQSTSSAAVRLVSAETETTTLCTALISIPLIATDIGQRHTEAGKEIESICSLVDATGKHPVMLLAVVATRSNEMYSCWRVLQENPINIFENLSS